MLPPLQTRFWTTPSAGSAMSMISGKFLLKMGRKSFIPQARDAADVEVFHRRDTDDGGGMDGVSAMRGVVKKNQRRSYETPLHGHEDLV